jgi:hypothetical protein
VRGAYPPPVRPLPWSSTLLRPEWVELTLLSERLAGVVSAWVA